MVKKVLKIIGIVALIFIVGLIVLFVVLSNKQFTPDKYWDKVETGGSIEEKYIKEGTYDISYKEYPILQGFKKFEIYYPSELEKNNKKYPVVVFCNGSGMLVSKYSNLLKHMASWGFITIGTEEEYDWSGQSAEVCVRFLTNISVDETILVGDKNEKNPFYNKIDLDNVGITGHSQGGVGVFNAVSAQEHASIYKAAVSLSPTKIELAENLYWHYDISQVTTPMLLLAGTNEDAFVTPETLKDMYDMLPNNTTKVMATRDKAEHNDMLYWSDGYVTAWFMYYLYGDTEAGRAFFGNSAEILSNQLYQNQYINQK